MPPTQADGPLTAAKPGKGVTLNVWQTCGPVSQLLEGVTQTFPVGPRVTLMDEVPCPELIVHPAGTVQLYEVAFVADAESVAVPPWQTEPELLSVAVPTDLKVPSNDKLSK